MATGRFGFPRPLVESDMEVMMRFRIGGDIRGMDTEYLQATSEPREELFARLESNTDADIASAHIGPAGSIVGVRVGVGDNVGRNQIDEITDVTRNFLEDELGESATLKPAPEDPDSVVVRIT